MDRSIPVRINGDDIVFRATPRVVERWKEGVSQAGLVLSAGKTIVESRYFTLNSTLFKAGPKGPRLVPFIRSKALFGMDQEDSVASLRGRFYSFCPGYGSKRRASARVVFLRENSGWIRKSCRSLTKGLGIQVEPEVIAEAGMLGRELRYLAEVEKPLPNLVTEWGHMPEGYHLRWVDKDTKRCRSKDKGLEAAFLDAAWRPRNDNVSWKSRDEVYCRGLDLSDAIVLRKKEWTTRMVRLGGDLIDRFYPGIRGMYRWIKCQFSRIDRSLIQKKPQKQFACWYPNYESKPLIFRSDRTSEVINCRDLVVSGRGVDHCTIDGLCERSKESDSSILDTGSLPAIGQVEQGRYTRVPPPACLDVLLERHIDDDIRLERYIQ